MRFRSVLITVLKLGLNCISSMGYVPAWKGTLRNLCCLLVTGTNSLHFISPHICMSTSLDLQHEGTVSFEHRGHSNERLCSTLIINPSLYRHSNLCCLNTWMNNWFFLNSMQFEMNIFNVKLTNIWLEIFPSQICLKGLVKVPNYALNSEAG